MELKFRGGAGRWESAADCKLFGVGRGTVVFFPSCARLFATCKRPGACTTLARGLPVDEGVCKGPKMCMNVFGGVGSMFTVHENPRKTHFLLNLSTFHVFSAKITKTVSI